MKSMLLKVFLLSILLTGAVHASEIYLAKDGKPQMTIVIPAKYNKSISDAAHTLRNYIEKICGVKLAINKDGKRVPGKAFYIGACQGAPRCDLPKSGANWEGYVITEKDGDVYFNGLNPTPIAMGVYSFLEDDLGVRWFAPGELWELVPKSKTPGTLKVDVKSRTVVPQTSPRIWSGHYFGDEWTSWSRRNKIGSSEIVSKRNFQNMLSRILPPEKYGKTHLEYYPMMPDGKRFVPPVGSVAWRPCESNPEVQKIVIDYINDYFSKYTNQDSFSLGMDDITRMCCCAGCRAMDDAPDSFEKQRFSDRHYKFVNIVAKEVRKKHPDKYIGVLIYQITRELPKQVPVMEPNVFGYITETSANWWKNGLMQKDNALTAQWRKRVQHLSRYDYYGQGSMVPRYYPHYVDKQLKYDKSLGMEGMYIETYAFLPLTMPMLWQLSKLQWDASLDTDKLLDEFMNIYGAAKPQMAQFWDLLEKTYQQPRPNRGGEVWSITGQAQAASPEDLDKAFALLAEAEKAAAGDAKVLARIDIHKNALKLSAYAVKPYALNLQIRDIKIDSQAAADKVLELIKKLEEVKVGRDEFIESLRKRDDLLGKNVVGFEKFYPRYLRLGSFAELESDSIMALMQAFNWYGKNAPDKLEKRVAQLNCNAVSEYAAYYLQNLRKGKKPENLIRNGGFEIRDEAWEKSHAGCPKDWGRWTRGGRAVKVDFVPGRNGNALKLSRCDAALGNLLQVVDAEEGGVYLLSCYMKMSGTARGGLAIRFRTQSGAYCKDQKSEVGIMLPAGQTDDWKLIALLVQVPKGIGAKRISIHPEFSGLQGDSSLLIDDIEICRIK